jgi:phosphatidylserine decarboxylase
MSTIKSTLKSTLKRIIIPISNEGYGIIVAFALLCALLSLIWSILGVISFVILLLCVYFFRDPERVINNEEDVLVAPADGVVDAIENVSPPSELGMDENAKWTRVSIFLSVFNVHIQRVPVDGKVTKLLYREGTFLNVSLDKYSKDNERQSCVLVTKNGLEIVFVQIAGMIARRIVCNLKVDQEVRKGDKYGIIKFGSRVDIYLPETVIPKVRVGQTMIAGESIIARFK